MIRTANADQYLLVNIKDHLEMSYMFIPSIPCATLTASPVSGARAPLVAASRTVGDRQQLLWRSVAREGINK